MAPFSSRFMVWHGPHHRSHGVNSWQPPCELSYSLKGRIYTHQAQIKTLAHMIPCMRVSARSIAICGLLRRQLHLGVVSGRYSQHPKMPSTQKGAHTPKSTPHARVLRTMTARPHLRNRKEKNCKNKQKKNSSNDQNSWKKKRNSRKNTNNNNKNKDKRKEEEED